MTLVKEWQGRLHAREAIVMLETTSMGPYRDWTQLQIQHGQVEGYG